MKNTVTVENNKTFKRKLLPLAVGALLLSGCAITPQPLTEQELRDTINASRTDMFRNQEAISGQLTLDEAMARAVKYNLDNRVKLMEQALAERQLDMANLDLLPKLTAAAGYTNRDNELASSSEDIITRRQSLVPSTSSDKEQRNADLTLSWNVLDFGVGYFNAKQQADRVLVMQERRRKVVHQLMQQVRLAYWQALGAQQLESKIGPVLRDAEQALADLQKVEQERLKSPLETLNAQRQLLDIIRQLDSIQNELAQAKPRLAAIMNSPTQDFRLSAPPAELGAPAFNMSLQQMEENALLHRPELVEAAYNERISVTETRKALAKLFPGLEFSAGTHYDTNSFLVNNHWNDAGIRVSWNLLNVLHAGSIKKTAEAQRQIAHEQRLALNMAVLTQVHVAYRDFLGQKRQYELSNTLNTVEQRILNHTRNAAQLNAEAKVQEIRAAASAIVAELRRYQSYGALQSSYGQLQTTLGQDPIAAEAAGHDVASLRKAVAQADADWQNKQQGRKQ